MLWLGGCGVFYKIQPPPEAPQQLLKPCPALTQIGSEHTLHNLSLVILENYTKYHLCSAQVDSWLEWYNTLHKKDK
jgi:hypothetical protein